MRFVAQQIGKRRWLQDGSGEFKRIVHNPDPPSKRSAIKPPDADLQESLRELIGEEISAALAK